MSLSPRVTRGSLHHLSPDFDWNLLEQQPSHFTATEDHALSTADSKGKEKKEKKDKKKEERRKEGAIPKTRPSDSTSASLQFPSDLPSPECDQVGTPPSTRDEIIRLQLIKDTTAKFASNWNCASNWLNWKTKQSACLLVQRKPRPVNPSET